MSSRNFQTQNSQSELNEILSNSPTLLFLQGQISFQDYQNYVENQQVQNELVNQNELVASNEVEISADGISSEVSNSLLTAPRTSGYKRLKSVSESSGSVGAKKKAKASEDDIEALIEMEVQAAMDDSDDEYEAIEENDEATRWKDFDIETLNFDKFISDYSARSTSGDSADENGKSSPSKSKSKPPPMSGGFGKRKKGDSNADPSELRTKRRVGGRRTTPVWQSFHGLKRSSFSATESCLQRYKA